VVLSNHQKKPAVEERGENEVALVHENPEVGRRKVVVKSVKLSAMIRLK